MNLGSNLGSSLRAFPPAIYSVADFEGATIPALAAGVPGAVGPIRFQFPRPQFIEGVLIVPSGALLGVPVEMAKLGIEILDATSREIVTDGRAQARGLVLPFELPGLSLGGFGIRPFALQRPVAAGDAWQITISNRHTATIDTMAVLFYARRSYQ